MQKRGTLKLIFRNIIGKVTLSFSGTGTEVSK
jgi:hypothetical protein